MRYLRYLALLSVCLFAASYSNAQLRVGVGVGVGPVGGYYGGAPVCSYGYYGYAPYACAPYGYYGSDYFVGGVFIGAGPWFHGWGYGRGGFGYGRGYYNAALELMWPVAVSAGVALPAAAVASTVAAEPTSAAVEAVSTAAVVTVAADIAKFRNATHSKAFQRLADSLCQPFLFVADICGRHW